MDRSLTDTSSVKPAAGDFLGIEPNHPEQCATVDSIVRGRLELIENPGEYALVHLIGEAGVEFIVKLDLSPTESKGELLSFNAPADRIHTFEENTGLRRTS